MAFTREKGLVSIVVTAHNYRRYVTDCLESLAQQTYRHIEVIVVDDASRDGTATAVRHFRQRMKLPLKHRTVLIALPRNTGYAGAVTTGLFLAKGEFIAMQDMDDISDKTRIERQVSYLQRHPNISMVGTNYASFKDGHFKRRTPANWIAYGDAIQKKYAEGGHAVSVGTVMLRGKAFDRIGGMTRRVRGAEDYELVTKFLRAKEGVANLKSILYYYRVHSGQRSRKFYG